MKTFSTLEARPFCHACKRPQASCYCAELRPVSSRPRIVILMHPLEARHPVGTGRIAHRSLENSHLWVGTEFGEDSELVKLLRNPSLRPMLLYPGPHSLDLDLLGEADRCSLVSDPRELVIIVLDATWALARKMLRLSPELGRIPRVSFAPTLTSRFLIRRQPRPECLSSIEAIHRVLELLDPSSDYGPMISIFHRMVDRQLACARGIP